MITTKTKRVLQSEVYNYKRFPIENGQTFHTDRGIFYQDMDGVRCAIVKTASIKGNSTPLFEGQELEHLRGHHLIVKYGNSMDYDRYYVDPETGKAVKLRSKNSAGLIDNPSSLIVDYIEGTLETEEMFINLYSTDDFSGAIHSYRFESKIFQIDDIEEGVTHYLIAEFNNGDPQLRIIEDLSYINSSNIILIYTIDKTVQGSAVTIHQLSSGNLGEGLVDKLNRRLIKTEGFRPESEIPLSFTYGQNNYLISIQSGTGTVWYGGTAVNLTDKDSLITNQSMWVWYHSTTQNWVYSKLPYLPNSSFSSILQYDGPTGLTNIQNSSYYGVAWVFRVINSENDIHVVLGDSDYSQLSLAQESELQDIPSLMRSQGLLTGRLIFSGDGTNVYVENFFGAYSSGGGGSSGTTDHNQLIGRDAPDQHPMGSITDLIEGVDPYLDQKLKTTDTPQFEGVDITTEWKITSDNDKLKIQQKSTSDDVIEIYETFETSTEDSINAKVKINAKTEIAELDFGGW